MNLTKNKLRARFVFRAILGPAVIRPFYLVGLYQSDSLMFLGHAGLPP